MFVSLNLSKSGRERGSGLEDGFDRQEEHLKVGGE